MSSLSFNKKSNILYFILYSLIVSLLSMVFNNGIVHIVLIFSHILFIYFFRKPSIRVDNITKILFLFLIYFLFQALILDISFLSFIQSITITVLYIVFYFYIGNVINNSDIKNNIFKTSKVLLFILPFFLISFSYWSESRESGIFGNPNITAHITVLLSPIIALGLNGKKKLFLLFITTIIITLTASRSAALALILGFFTYYISQKINFKFHLSILVLGIVFLISWFSIDLASFSQDYLSIRKNENNSRLLYLDSNGREQLIDVALDKFYSSPYWGLGFDSNKFQLNEDIELGTHNSLMDILLRMGLIGTSMFTILLLIITKNISNTPKNQQKSLTLSCFAILLSLSTNSVVFWVFNYYFFYFLIIYAINQNPYILNSSDKKKNNNIYKSK